MIEKDNVIFTMIRRVQVERRDRHLVPESCSASDLLKRARGAGVSKRDVEKGCARLEALGLIRRQRGLNYDLFEVAAPYQEKEVAE